jgi:hypothetical protein
MKKHMTYIIILFIAIMITGIVSASLSAYAAQSNARLRINVNIIAGDLVVYSPPDFTTPIFAWSYDTMKRGYNYESTFRVANTSSNPITCNPKTVNPDTGETENVTYANVTFSPTNFTLNSGTYQDLHVAIWVHPDAPVTNRAFDIGF